METIPSVYWMIIIAFVVFMICLVLYYLAMLIRETRDVVGDTRPILKSTQQILDQSTLIVEDAQKSVSMLRGIIEELNDAVLVPIRKLGNIVTIASDFLTSVKRK
jgi:predicted PurR-regulated permease PerM